MVNACLAQIIAIDVLLIQFVLYVILVSIYSNLHAQINVQIQLSHLLTHNHVKIAQMVAELAKI